MGHVYEQQKDVRVVVTSLSLIIPTSLLPVPPRKGRI